MTWLSRAWPHVLELLASHALLTAPAVVLSIVIAVPIGLLAHRRPALGSVVLGGATLMYAIPSLPLVIMIPAIFGTPLRSGATVVIALVFYGVALLVRSAADAFAAVDDDTRRAAVAIGFAGPSVFWKVDLLRAVPLLVAGVRVVSVSTVGLVTIGALIGVPGLGTLFTDGFQRGILAEVVTGMVATVALALFLDGVWVALGWVAAPWHRRDAGGETT
ncbi:ABC transporter permease [Microbacterium sp. NPDC055683]